MRTTIDIPSDLLGDAMRLAHTKTKTMTVILGLQELINHHKLQRLRALRGKINLTTDVRMARKRLS
jgi:Arc/MetJ family transcription regulator